MGNRGNKTRGTNLKSIMARGTAALTVLAGVCLLAQSGITHASVMAPPEAPAGNPSAAVSEIPPPEYTGPSGASSSSRITVTGAMQPYVAVKAALDLSGVRTDGVDVHLTDIYCDITRGDLDDPQSRDLFACSVSLSDGEYQATIKTWDQSGAVRTAQGSFSVAVPLQYSGPAGTVADPEVTVRAVLERFVARKARLDINGTRADGSPLALSDLYCEIARGYPDSFACPVSLSDGNYLATVKVWDENGFPRTAGGNFTVAQKPLLAISSHAAFWRSYTDYRGRDVTVEIAVANESQADAFDLRLTAALNTDGVTLNSPIPLGIGDIASGGRASALLSYHVPAGVSIFRSQLTAAASNSAGREYRYP